MPLYVFLNSLSQKQAMLGVYHGYSKDTALIQRGYSVDTALELGKFTYPKMLHILYVVLYSVALLFSVSYKNRGLGLPEVVVCTMRIKTMVDLKIGSFFTHGVGQYRIFLVVCCVKGGQTRQEIWVGVVSVKVCNRLPVTHTCRTVSVVVGGSGRRAALFAISFFSLKGEEHRGSYYLESQPQADVYTTCCQIIRYRQARKTSCFLWHGHP